MKIKIEFQHTDSGDFESNFKSVELETIPADSVERWADAVWEFVSTAGTCWDKNEIIITAASLLHGEAMDKLKKILLEPDNPNRWNEPA